MGPDALPPERSEASELRQKPSDGAPRQWLGRLTLAFGAARPSRQESALELDGYGSARYLVAIEAGGFVADEVVLAGFLLGSGRSDDSHYGGPTLREESYGAGVALPVVARLPFGNLLLLSPRVGFGVGSQNFHGDHHFALGAGFGADLSLLVTRAHLGFGLGFWSLRVGGKGAAESNDFGASYLMVNGLVGK
ncbi:MAG TPA: hypothetical protein VG937_14375 [Polyangiaceae bacterium]|jgi:hypothetical protein|nr:hypothetical protein [Polyangiaceae bacterium]